MIRQTSIDAYNTITQNGSLGTKRQIVYETLFDHGPCTAMELRARFPAEKLESQFRARLTELRAMGVVQEVGKKRCSVTGVMVILWDVTPNLPLPMKKLTHTCDKCHGKGVVDVESEPSIQQEL